MAKDPAFLFYSKDWLAGTAELLPAEKGVLMDLLCFQHQNGSLPTDLPRIARLVGLSLDEFEPIWKTLSAKFYLRDNRLINRKLETVMHERAEKGLRNKIIGTFASVMRAANLSKEQYGIARKSFNPENFTEVPTERLTERLTEWLKSIVNGNEDGNANANEADNGNGTENATAREKPESLHQRMKEAFITTRHRKTHSPFCWDAKSATHLNFIVPKIKTVAKCNDDETVLQFWQTLLDNLPEWYLVKGFSPATINSKFNEIITQIHKPHVTNQLTLDRELAEIAAAGNPYART